MLLENQTKLVEPCSLWVCVLVPPKLATICKVGKWWWGNDSHYQCLRQPLIFGLVLKWQSSFGRSVKIGERGRQFSNNCSSPVHTILKVIGPRFFQRRKRSRRGGRWSSRSCKAPNTKVSQRMCFRHAIQTEFKTLEFRNRLWSYWDYKTCQKSGETQALYQFCIKLPVFPLALEPYLGFYSVAQKRKLRDKTTAWILQRP